MHVRTVRVRLLRVVERRQWHAGQLRTVSKLEKRVAAAVHLGFDRVVAPVGTEQVVSKHLKPHVVQCRDVRDLVRFVRRNAPTASLADADQHDIDTDATEETFLGSDGNLETQKHGESTSGRGHHRTRGRMRRMWRSKIGHSAHNAAKGPAGAV
jgi:PHD/YefM family antitoxin component YafN of YafNO toxin-antitoxin module